MLTKPVTVVVNAQPTVDVTASPEEVKESSAYRYLELTWNTERDTLGANGMLQHQFLNNNDAEVFSDWLKTQSHLSSLDMDIEKPRKEKIDGQTVFVVHVSSSQFNGVIGDNSFDDLMPQNKLKELAADVLASLNNFDEKKIDKMRMKVNVPELINSELNQKRFIKCCQLYKPNTFFHLAEIANVDLLKVFTSIFKQSIVDLACSERDSLSKSVITHYCEKKRTLNDFIFTLLQFISPALVRLLSQKLNSDGRVDFDLLCSANEDSLSQIFAAIGQESFSQIALLVGMDRFLSIKMPEKALLTFLSFFKPETVDTLFTVAPVNRTRLNTPLRELIKKQSTTVVMAVMKALSAAALGTALNQQDNRQRNGLLSLIYHTTDAVTLYAIQKISTADFDKLISTPADDGCTPLHDAPKYLSEAVIGKMIELASPTALNKCCTSPKQNRSVINFMFLYLSGPTIVSFLKKIDYASLTFLFKFNSEALVPQNYVNKIAEGLLNDPAWQVEELIKDLFKVMGDQLAPIFLKHWNTGNPLSQVARDCVLQHISFFTDEEKNAFLAYKPVEWYLSKYEEKRDETPITTSKNKYVELEAKDLVETIWTEGFLKWEDFRRLKTLKLKSPHLGVVLETLYATGKVTSGAASDFSIAVVDAKEDEQLKKLINCTMEENTLIKIIKDKDWLEFFKQLRDYKYRAPLRDSEVNKKDTKHYTHKFVHLKGIIEPYIAKRRAKKSAEFKYTKKTSATLISKNMNTAVFGEHDHSRDLVGLLFDMSKCKVKGMFTQDRGTFRRNWIGTKEEVEAYAKSMEGVTFSEVNAFREEVRKNPHRLNELLVGFSRESVMAVVIVTDSPEAREAAIARQKQLSGKLHIHVPITYYDRPLQKIRMLANHQEKLIQAIIINDPTILVQKAMMPATQFSDFINNLSKEMLGLVVRKRSEKHEGRTALQQVAISQPANVFLRFLRMLPKTKEAYGLDIVDNKNNNTLAIIARNQQPEVFSEYIEDLFNSSLFNPLPVVLNSKNSDSISCLNIMLEYQSESDIAICFDTIKSISIDPAIFLDQSNATKDNTFHLAAKKEKFLIFKKCIDLVDSKVMASAFSQKNRDGNTPLHIIIDKFTAEQAYEIFNFHVSNMDKKVIDSIFSLKNNNKETLLYLVAKRYRISEFATSYLMTSIFALPSEATLEKIALSTTAWNDNLVDLTLNHLSPCLVLILLNKMSETALEKLFFQDKMHEERIVKLCNVLLEKGDEFPKTLINKFFSIPTFETFFISTAEQYWLNGHSLSVALIKKIDNFLSVSRKKLTSERREILRSIVNFKEKSSISLPSKIDIAGIWENGVKSWAEYHLLRKHQYSIPGLTEVLDYLQHANCLMIGSAFPFRKNETGSSLYLTINDITANASIVKMIADEDWENNLKLLLDFHFQLPEDSIEEAKYDRYEYDFNNDKIIPYNPNNHDEEKAYSRETTASILSRELNNSLTSGSEGETRQVGLLFKSNDCIIHTMLPTDNLLSPNQWIGSREKIETFQKDVFALNLMSPEFQRPYAINQALVRLSPRGLCAIIIAHDTPHAREVARVRQADIFSRFGMALPILIYHQAIRQLRAYSKEEQEEDLSFKQTGKLVNITAEKEAHARMLAPMNTDKQVRARMLALKADIENDKQLNRYSLWFLKMRKIPIKAAEILKIIEIAENDPNTVWGEIAKKVEEKLRDALDNESKDQSAENFYQNEIKKYFS